MRPSNPESLETQTQDEFLRPDYSVTVAGPEEIWLPLVDEPVGNIVAEIQAEDPEIDRLVGSRHRILAFRTFAYIRVGLLLGELPDPKYADDEPLGPDDAARERFREFARKQLAGD